jgi:hypothetical protein
VVAGLVDLGVPQDEAETYAESIRRGGALVSVSLDDEAHVARAESILNRYSPVNVRERGDVYRQAGWTGYDVNAKPYTEAEMRDFRSGYTSTPERVPVVEGVTAGYAEWEPRFRTHYNSNYATSGETWNTYSPAYQFGYELANDQRYNGWSWDRVESDAQYRWDRDYPSSPSTWQKFKNAIHEAWDEVRGVK